jgi:hypothetical protein
LRFLQIEQALQFIQKMAAHERQSAGADGGPEPSLDRLLIDFGSTSSSKG